MTTGTEVPAGASDGAAPGAGVVVRRVLESDFERWLPLWQGYLRFYREPLADSTTRRTFERLVHRDEGMVGLVATGGSSDAGDGGLLGLAHLVFHASTWTTRSYCYLEDLWVAAAARGARVGNALIEATYRTAGESGAARVYWQTQQYNGPARSLYDTVATPTSFVVYEHPLPSTT